jgi:tetratricopeptide (TPR) repeat protein
VKSFQTPKIGWLCILSYDIVPKFDAPKDRAMALRIIALMACLAAAPALAQSTVDIPNAQARVIATRAVQAGDYGLAIEIARQLLSQDPDDRAALIVMAAAAPQIGDFDAGRRAGARAWRVSQTDAQKYEAARLAALAAANAERFTRSTIWLRRALTVAPNDTEFERTITDARAISRRNPWSTSLSFSVVPSNNVNGGTDDDTLTAPGNFDGQLSDDALALAGIRASVGFRTQYRLHATPNSRTTVGLQFNATRVRLEDGAPLPDAAFDTDTTLINLTYERALPKGAISVTAATGVSHYAAGSEGEAEIDAYKYDILRLGLRYRRPLDSRSAVSFDVQSEQLTYDSVYIGEVDRTNLNTSYTRRTDDGNTWRAAISYTDSDSASANYVFESVSLQGSYTWREPIGPVSLTVGAGVTWADYPDYSLLFAVTGGRQDTTLFYTINMKFDDLSYAGFTPGISVNHSFAESNVSRFTRDTLAVGFTLTSQF